MPDISLERAHLAQAERHLSEGGTRLFRQEELVRRLRAEGRDTAAAETLLRNLQDTLEAWKAHHLQILRRLEGLGK